MKYCRNLLLPAGVPLERQRAAYRVIIHRAEELPRMDIGIMASVKKAMLMNKTDFIDAYVRVSFVGHVVRSFYFVIFTLCKKLFSAINVFKLTIKARVGAHLPLPQDS